MAPKPSHHQAVQCLSAMLENRPHRLGIDKDVQKGHHARVSRALHDHDLYDSALQDFRPGRVRLRKRFHRNRVAVAIPGFSHATECPMAQAPVGVRVQVLESGPAM